MATQVQFRRGTTSQNNAFTGAQGELTIDNEVWTIRIHDGVTAGGKQVPTLTATQTFTNKTMSTNSVWNGNAVGLGYGGTGASLSGVAGAVVYSTGSAMALSLAGTSGQVLTSGGTSGPTWVNASALSTGTATTATTATNIAGGSAGYLVYQQDTNTTAFIAPGTSGYVLRSTGASTSPNWVSPTLTLGSTGMELGSTYTNIDGINTFYITGTTDASSSTTGVLRVAGGISTQKKLYVGTDLNVGGNATITGNLTVNGTTTTVNSTTVTIDDPIFTLGGDSTPASDDNKDRGIEFKWHNGSAAKVGFFGYDDSAGKFTFIPDATNTSEVFSGTAGPVAFGAIEGTTGSFSSTLAVTGVTTLTGALNANGGIAVDTNAFTVADTTGNTAIAGTLTVTGATVLNGGLTMDSNKFTVADTTGNTSIGGTLAVTGNTTLSGTLAVTGNQTNTGDLAVNGGDITTSSSTFNLLETNATTVNAFGAATTIDIGASTGTMTVNNQQVVFNSTDSIQIPVGTTLQRDGTPVTGQIRYNTDLSTFEGYAASAWGSLGGVTSVDKFTYIIAETSAGASNGDLDFYAENAGGTAATQVGQWNRTNLKDYTGTLVGTQTTQNVFNTTATTVNAFGAATALNLGASTGTLTVANTTLAAKAITASTTLTVTGATVLNGGLTMDTDKFTVADTTGNTSIGGTLAVTGATTLTGGLAANGGITVDSTAFVVADTTGNTSIAGTLSVTGATVLNGGLTMDTNKFTVADTTGNTSIGGTLAVTGATTLSSALTYGGVTLSNSVTGTGSMVLSTSPTLVTPALGTPSSGTLTSCTGLPVATGISGLGTGVATFLATPSSANLISAVTDETGSGALVFGTSPTFTTSVVAGSSTMAVFNTTATTVNAFGAATTLSLGAATGTTTVNNSLTITGDLVVNGTTTTVNSTNVSIDNNIFNLGGDTAPSVDDAKDRGVSFRWHNGTGAKQGFFGWDRSTARFSFVPDATLTSDVVSGTQGDIDVNNIYINGTAATGTGGVVRATSPTLVTPVLGTPSSGTLTNCTGLPISTGVSGLGTGIATFLATPSSANLIAAVTDETGTGALVFANTPTLVTPNIGAATGTSLSVSGSLTSTVATGTAPLVVTSTTMVSNLNVDYLDGQHGSYYTTAGNLSGTIPSAVLGNSTHYIGTTAVTLNRSSANLALTGISSVTLPGSTSGTIQVTPAAVAGTGTVITLPATTGTVVTTGDTGTVTNAMLAGSIANAKLANSTISGVALGSNLATLTMGVAGTGLSGSTTYNGSGAATFTVTSNATNANTASAIVARDASGNFSAGTITAALSGNATTATTLATSRTISLGGDLSGSASFNGSADITITATIAANSVALGTDTTGAYVVDCVAGTGISLSETANNDEGNTVTITNSGVTSAVAGTGVSVSGATGAVTFSIGQAVATSSSVTFSSVTAGSFTETSDERLKTDITAIENALDIVNSLEGKAFVKNGKASIGLIAQQVERVLPQVVNTADDEMKTMSVQYGNIVAVLIEAVKEQQKQIEELKAKVGN